MPAQSRGGPCPTILGPARVALRFLAVAVSLFATDVVRAEDLPWSDGSTTVVVLPDTERYSDDYPEYFESQLKWVAESHERRNIAYVIHLGDITQHNAPAEWEVARRCFGLLGGRVPCALAPGNHDYDDNAPKRETSRLSEYFPVEAVKRWPTFGGVFEEGRLENCFHLTRIGARDWIILVLEIGPRDEVVAWANEVLERYPDRLGMLVTHAYLFRNNVRYDHRRGSQRASPHGWGNDGEELWQKLVRRHRNMMIVLSGHVSTGGLGYLASEGDYGNIVHQMMVDYEKMRGGGMAYLRLLEFLPDGKTVQVRTYSPALEKTRDSGLEEFRFELQGPTRAEPRPVGEISATPLEAPPAHRYSFDRGPQETVLADSIGGAHAVLRREGSESRLNGRGQLLLEGGGHVALPPRILEGLEDISVEVWFAPTAGSYRWQSVWRLGDRDDWLTYVFRTLTVHRAEMGIDGHNEDIQRDVEVEPGESLHVVVTYDHDGADGGPLLGYYRNGESFGARPTGLRLADIDGTGHRVGPFPGRFDELRVHGRALGPQEVLGSYRAGPDTLELARGADHPGFRVPRELAVPEWASSERPLRRPPVHRYSFNGRGGDGARITDTVGDAHGIVDAGETDSALDGKGQLVLRGDGHVRLAAGLLDGLDDVSFEVWFTPTADDYSWKSVVRLGDRDDWLTYVFRGLNVHRAEIAVAGHNEDIQRRVTVQPGTPMHVVVTYDRDGADGQPLLGAYRDGAPIGTMRVGLSLGDVDDTANTIGPFEGSFDELRIYDYPLDPAEVRSSHEAGPETLETSRARS